MKLLDQYMHYGKEEIKAWTWSKLGFDLEKRNYLVPHIRLSRRR